MNLPRIFGRKSQATNTPRVTTTTKVKNLSGSNNENGLFPARIITNKRNIFFGLAWKSILLSLILVAALSLSGYLRVITDYISSFSTEAGGLIVSSEYLQSNVYIDGKLVGQTPYTGESIRAGRHDIRISATENINSFFVDKTLSVRVYPGNTTIIKIALAPTDDLISYAVITPHQKVWNEQTLVITGAPGETFVTIDGAPMGMVPVETSSILEGAHKLTLSSPGYKDMEIDVNVQPQRSVNIDFRLYKYQLMLEEKDEN